MEETKLYYEKMRAWGRGYPGLGPLRGEKGKSLSVCGEDLAPQPNHWTESPRGDGKEGGACRPGGGVCQSRGGAYRGGGALGTCLPLGS